MIKNEGKNELESFLRKLEDIVSSLEKKDVSLREHLEKFKEGAVLAKKIKEYLKEAENEFKKIKLELMQEE